MIGLSQDITAWATTMTVLIVGFWRLSSLLVRVVKAVGAVPALQERVADHEVRLARMEDRSTA